MPNNFIHDQNPFISVVIPTHNRGEFIMRAVHSALDQSYGNIEVIVVDDGSTDDTGQRISYMQARDSRLKIIRHENNLGAQAARNTGIRAAAGSFIAFLDSDDEWLASKLEKQISLIETSGRNVGVIYAGFRRVYEDGRTTTEHLPLVRGNIYKDALREWIADMDTLLVQKDILYRAGLLDERIRSYQEWDLCIRLAKISAFDFVQEPLAAYHIHNKPTISQNLKLEALGYLDVITIHREEIIHELGNDAFARHLFSASLRFADINDFETAIRLTVEAIRHGHLFRRCMFIIAWCIFHCGSWPYKTITSSFRNIKFLFRWFTRTK